MGINFIPVNNINSGVSSDPEAFVDGAEQIYFDRLHLASEKIRLQSRDKPVVLLSGPSGSGKTTSALRIAGLIEKKGLKVHIISMDNYFLPNGAGEMPLDEEGRIDLESPLRMDIGLFSKHLKKLIDGESVDMPVFDFATQSVFEHIPVRRGKDEIILFEGIHALNPLVTGNMNDSTACIYVSVRTRLKNGKGETLHPSNIRLMRRLSRDRLFRGRKYSEIFEMNKSVLRGEELYIIPYKHRADIDIDTFIAYEACVYKKILLPELTDSVDECGMHGEYDALLGILNEISPLDLSFAPGDSLVREFAGGSVLKY